MQTTWRPSSWLQRSSVSSHRQVIALLAVLWLVLGAFGLLSERRGLVAAVTTMLMYLLIVQGWSVLGGYAGYLSFATSGFFGIGAYVSAIGADSLPVPFVLTPVLAMIVAGAVAMFVGPPALRLRGAYFVVFSLIFGLVIQTLVRNLGITRGALGMFAPRLPFDAATTANVWFASFLSLALIATYVVYRMQTSKVGDALTSVREDEDAAAILGIQVNPLKYVAFATGASVAALAGSLQAYRLGYIEPTGVLSLDLALDVVIIAVVGGLGRWYGPLLGIPVVMGIAELLRVGITRLPMQLPAESNRIVLGVAVVAVALLAPKGLASLLAGRERSKPMV